MNNPAISAAPCQQGQSSKPARYDVLTRILHWIFALAIIYASFVGFSLQHISNIPLRTFLSHLNMSLASVLLTLYPIRLYWRLKRQQPHAISGVSLFQQQAARSVHQLLYLVILCVLVSGFLMVPDGYYFFGLVWIPTPFHRGWLTQLLFIMHRDSCMVLAGLVLLHIAAVAKHQLMGRSVLRRML